MKRLVFLFIALFLISPVARAEDSMPICVYDCSEPMSVGMQRPVYLYGRLQTGVFAIGGETTGVTLQTYYGTFELQLPPHLRYYAERLEGRNVYVRGTLYIRRGVEVPIRRIVYVHSISARPGWW